MTNINTIHSRFHCNRGLRRKKSSVKHIHTFFKGEKSNLCVITLKPVAGIPAVSPAAFLAVAAPQAQQRGQQHVPAGKHEWAREAMSFTGIHRLIVKEQSWSFIPPQGRHWCIQAHDTRSAWDSVSAMRRGQPGPGTSGESSRGQQTHCGLREKTPCNKHTGSSRVLSLGSGTPWERSPTYAGSQQAQPWGSRWSWWAQWGLGSDGSHGGRALPQPMPGASAPLCTSPTAKFHPHPTPFR